MNILESVSMATCDESRLYIGEDTVWRVVNEKASSLYHQIYQELPANILDKLIPYKRLTNSNSIPLAEEEVLLAHPKIPFISYPHEWPGSMLKDAAIFHLELANSLIEHNYCLKDAHPWNLLYDNGKFIFIDLPSILPINMLPKWFHENYDKNLDLHKADVKTSYTVLLSLIRTNFIPYFIYPLLGYAYGKRSWVRAKLEETTLNTTTEILSFRQLLPERRLSFGNIRKAASLTHSIHQLNRICKSYTPKNHIISFYKNLLKFLENIDVKMANSAYSDYYASKKEDNACHLYEEFNPKQQAVYCALDDPNIHSVVDVACNTGWYSRLAATLKKSVVAFDIDEGCIEKLYDDARKYKLNILPLVMSITEPTKDRYSYLDGKNVLINSQKRFKADAVLALGILHHLVLGLGLSIESALEKLVQFTRNKLILEYVDLSDDLIKSHRDFFPALYANESIAQYYNKAAIYSELKKTFRVLTEKPSHPNTRSLIICEDKY